jgi:hypothetical protein
MQMQRPRRGRHSYITFRGQKVGHTCRVGLHKSKFSPGKKRRQRIWQSHHHDEDGGLNFRNGFYLKGCEAYSTARNAGVTLHAASRNHSGGHNKKQRPVTSIFIPLGIIRTHYILINDCQELANVFSQQALNWLCSVPRHIFARSPLQDYTQANLYLCVPLCILRVYVYMRILSCQWRSQLFRMAAKHNGPVHAHTVEHCGKGKTR